MKDIATALVDKLDLAGEGTRLGQVVSVAGLRDFPPTVLVGDGSVTRPMRVAGSVWSYHPGDTVVWVPRPGDPLVLARIPVVGSESDPTDDDFVPWREVGAASEPTFQNSWVNYADGIHETAGFWKQSDGWVRLKGLVKNGTTAAGTVIFTLPSGYAPPWTCYFVVSTNSDAGVIRVETSGTVRVHGAISNLYASLANITFPTSFTGSLEPLDAVNPGNWEIPHFNTGWSAGKTYTGSEIEIFIRSDGWSWIKGIIDTQSVPGNVMSLPNKSAMGWLAQVFPALGFGAARHDIGGNSTSRHPRNWRIEAGGGVVEHVIGGLNWFGYGARRQDHQQLGTDVSFQNGWSNYGPDFQNVQYYKDCHGVVHVYGMAQGDSSTADTICTLPVGYRPAMRQVFNGMWNNLQGRTDVGADGQVIAAGHPNNTWHTLSGGIAFRAMQ